MTSSTRFTIQYSGTASELAWIPAFRRLRFSAREVRGVGARLTRRLHTWSLDSGTGEGQQLRHRLEADSNLTLPVGNQAEPLLAEALGDHASVVLDDFRLARRPPIAGISRGHELPGFDARETWTCIPRLDNELDRFGGTVA